MTYMELGDAYHVGGPVLPDRDCFNCDAVGCPGCRPRTPAVLGFDLETASVDKLYTGGHEGPFVRLAGAREDDGTWQSIGPADGTYVEELLRADFRYGVNVFRFDIPALARHCGADFDALCEGAWDLAILGRLIDPPGAKGDHKPGYYGLDQMAKRYGHTGKSDDLAALALRYGPYIECTGCEMENANTEHPKHQDHKHAKKIFTTDGRTLRTPGRMPVGERRVLGYERIPVDDPEYRDYLRGDLEATAFVRREVFSRVTNWDYAAREMKVAAIQTRMTFNGWRVDRERLADRVRQEDERREGAKRLLVERYSLPTLKADGTESKSPWATKTGKLALEDAFRQRGAEFVPRSDNGELKLSKDALGPEWWVTKDENGRPLRVPGMTNPEAYGGNPAVVDLVSTILEASGATAKYAEIQGYLTEDGRVHAGIGEYQGSGRWAMTKPSITNLGKNGDKVQQRDPFVPEIGHVHLACDLSQVDMRGVAALSQDPGYMALFGFDAEGKPRDAHMDMAEVYFGERTKDARKRTKAINHKVNYGGSAYSTAMANGIPLAVVQDALEERDRAFPRLIEWTEEVREMGRRGVLLDNGFGRLMKCDPARAHTQAPALMGQGCARDIMCEALLRLVAMDRRVTAYLRGVVHDEVVLSVPSDEVEYWRGLLEAAFTFTWRDVPILCEVSQPGVNWADCYAEE